MKECTNCLTWKPADNEHFYKSKYTKDGFEAWCKKCKINYQKEYNQKPINKKRYSEYKHEWHIENKDKVNLKCRKWSKENRDRRNQTLREFFEKNPNKLKEYSNLRMNKKHNINQQEWDDCRIYFNFRCAYCGKTWEQNKIESSKDLHKEHVDPNGVDDLSNCVPACMVCNTEKWIYRLSEWYTPSNEVFDVERLYKIKNWLNGDYKKFLKGQ